MTFTPMNIVLLGVIALLGVGFYGLLVTRNLIKVVMVLQILIKGAITALVLAGKLSGNLGLGQATAATVIVADTIVAVVGLALAVQVRRRFGTLDVPKISTLRGWMAGILVALVILLPVGWCPGGLAGTEMTARSFSIRWQLFLAC